MAERLVLRLLGNFEVEADGQLVTHFEAASARALLAYLAAHRNVPQLRSLLATLLWGIDVGPTGLTNLRSALRRVRNAVDFDQEPPACLLTDRERVQLHPDMMVKTDTEQFDALLRSVQVHSHPSEHDCRECIACYRQAVALYRGPFLADLNVETELFDQWRTALQDRYRRQVLHALFVLAEHEFRLGSLAAAEVLVRQQLEIEHWNEEAHRQLMRVLLASGRRSAALSQYEACRQALTAELNAVPSEETDALYARIVAGAAPSAPIQLRNPYKGLEAFSVEDSLYFYGREVMTNLLLATVRDRPLVALIGASGSGKSSVIHAGLAARLSSPHQEGKPVDEVWRIASLRPGPAPLAALADALLECGYTPPLHSGLPELLRHEEVTLANVAAALSKANLTANNHAHRVVSQRLLLIVDQFEEIFTLCRDVQARNSFLRFVLGSAEDGELPETGTVVLLAMRADFLSQALQYRDLAGALQKHMLLLGPMIRSELQCAIEEPARLQGAALEPGLVDRILDDAGAEPGRLPLLQFALALLWVRQQDGWLTHATYDEIGGLRGALTDYADDVYQQLSPAEQEAAQRVFLALVEPGLDAQDIRRLATRAEMGHINWPVVQRLADARLVVTNTNLESEETVELAHETLIREWRRLRDWLAADQEFRRWQQQTRMGAEHWRQSSEDDSALLYGGRLEEAERWVNDRHTDINSLLHRYIAASTALREQRRLDEISRQERELEQLQATATADRRRLEVEQASRRRLRRLTIGVALATCLALGAALLAWQAQLRAEDNARIAHARQVAAQAVSVMQSKPDLALLLSLEALHLDGSPESRTTLFRDLDIDLRLQQILHGEPSALRSAGMQDQVQVLASNEQGAIIAWDLVSGEQRNVLDTDDDVAHAAAVSPTGDRFAITEGMTASLWDSTEFTRLALLDEHSGAITSVLFTPDGRRLVTVGSDGLVLLWDAQNGSFLQHLLRENSRQIYGPISADGTILLVGDSSEGEDALEIWDTRTNRRVGKPLLGHTDVVHGYSVSPDGRLLATASFDGSARLWEVASGAPVGEPFLGHAGRVLFAVFSPDGRSLVTGATDSKVMLWDVATHAQLGAPLQGHSNWVRVAEFSDDGQTLATGDDSGQMLLWDLSRERWLAGHTDRVRSLAISPDQQTLVTSGFDKRMIVWDAAALTQRQAIDTPHEHAIISVEFSPDGKTLVSVDAGGVIIFWDVATWRPRYPPQQVNPEALLINLTFSPDSSMVAAAAFDGVVRLWDVQTGELLPDPIRAYTTGWVLGVRFDPSGKLLATGGADGVIKLWDVASRQLIGEPLVGHSNRVMDLTFSPDGKVLASAGSDGTIRFWNVAEGTPAGAPLTSSSAQVWSVVQTPGEPEQITALSGDGSIAWWNAVEGELLRPLLRTGLETEEMKVAADGRRLYLASTGVEALALTPALGDWEQAACEIANRSLTEEEWTRYMYLLPYDPICH